MRPGPFEPSSLAGLARSVGHLGVGFTWALASNATLEATGSTSLRAVMEGLRGMSKSWSADTLVGRGKEFMDGQSQPVGGPPPVKVAC